MWIFIGILFRAKRIKTELEPEILVVSFGDELVQFVACAGARGRPGEWAHRSEKKKKRKRGRATRRCAAVLLARAGMYMCCVRGWLGCPGRSVFLLFSFLLLFIKSL
jgi:hypothetical protein